MNSHNITNESLALALMLVVVAILISHKEKLALEKDILWSVGRAIIQLIIVDYVLKYIFSVDDASPDIIPGKLTKPTVFAESTVGIKAARILSRINIAEACFGVAPRLSFS